MDVPAAGHRHAQARWHLSTLLFLLSRSSAGGSRCRTRTRSFATLLILAFLAGIGGGVFSGFMPSTSYFFPKAKQGTALGVQAGIGNFGVSVVQFVDPVDRRVRPDRRRAQVFTQHGKTGATKDVWYQNAAWIWVPFVLVAAVLAWTLLRSVPVQARGRPPAAGHLQQQAHLDHDRCSTSSPSEPSPGWRPPSAS